MNKKNIIRLHVFTWLFAAFLNLRDPSQLAGTERLLVYIISTFFILLSFYLFYLVIVPTFLEKRKYYLFLFVSLLSLNILTFTGYSAILLIKAFYTQDFRNFYSIYSFKMHFSGMTVMTIAATFGSFFRVLINWLNTMNQKEILEKQKAVSELALLKSKINPHFLFNTLNNIDALIYEDPDKASQALVKLSDIMRYMSYETVMEFVNLSKEMDYVSSLVALYKLRITNPEVIQLKIVQGFTDLKIAPMLFIPFIENAFKYSTFKGEKAGFEIKFETDESRINFSIKNYYNSSEKEMTAKQGGTGINSVKQRLEHIYPGKHILSIINSDGIFKVNLTIETNGN